MRSFISFALACFCAVPAWAENPVTSSPTPRARAEVAALTALAPGRVEQSIRPQGRKATRVQVSTANISFNNWVSRFRTRAIKAGIRAATLDRAMRGLRYNTAVIEKDRNQSEFTKQIWEYLDSAASPTRVSNGKQALRENRRMLDQIEAKYGVEKEVVTAIWGLESAYGTYRGNMPVIESLATLAFDGRRGSFFEAQLIAALKIIQSGDVAPRNMTGSWAGAMGHTQFIPTSYLSFAVDFTDDGKRDIWSDNPADALASTAAYLKKSGWTKRQPWGVEVKLPRGFNYASANRKTRKLPSQWAQLGVRGADGKRIADYGPASILLPAGAQGAAFMIFKNFSAIERYNAADAYVIGVGHLSDRIAGGPEIKANWPRQDRGLRFREKQEMQRLLSKRGFDTQGVDGIIGPRTIAAVREFQRSVGMVPDGYASLSILKKLR